MRANKKILLLSTLAVVGVLSIGAVSFLTSNKDDQASRLKASGEPYTLNITGLKSGNTTLTTTDGNDISFEINRYGEGVFLTDGYIKNVTPISGLESLTVSFTTLNADLTISYGWFYDDYYVTDGIVNSESATYEFGEQGPSFFKIENKSGARLDTTDIQLTYSCSETPLPPGYTNVQYTLADDGLSYYVSGCNSGVSTPIILSEYNGLPVTSIGGYAFHNCTSLTSGF